MTDEKIKELAREYAEDVFGEGDYPFKEDDMSNAEDDFESVVAFLSKTHCIVEKSKVRELHAHWEDRIKHTSSSRQMYRSRQIGVEEIFGWELFNGTEK